MFQNPRPVDTFRETVGWNLPASQSSYGLKVPPNRNTPSSSRSISPGRPNTRPQLSASASSSSSLGGLEQAVPSFQTFLQRIPSVDSDPNKPLPPTPISPERSEGSPVHSYHRKQSSVYSRSSSYASSDEHHVPFQIDLPERDPTAQQSPWKIGIPEDDPHPVLQPVTYNASSPHQMQKEEEQDEPVHHFLEPRVFSPLIATPSTMSVVTVDMPPENRPETTPPTTITSSGNPKAPTISLEQAKQAMKGPGAVPMLPEELRALRKVKSQGRLKSIDVFGAGQKARLPPTPTMLKDLQGHPGVKSPAQNAFPVGTGPPREMAPPRPERPASSHGSDEPRGRTMQRTSQQTDNLSGLPSQADFAKEYNSILSQQFRTSSSPGYESDESISTHLKMVPQALFQGKKKPHSRKSVGSGGSDFSVSPFSVHQRDGSTSRRSSGTGFNLRLSSMEASPASKDRSSENSMTGSIPISPPADHEAKHAKLPPIDTSLLQAASKPKPQKREKSISHYYPHMMRRKSPKNKNRSPGKPLLTPSVIAHKLKTPDTTPETSPLAHSPLNVPASARKPSDAGSERSKRRVLHRIADGVRGRRRSSQKENSAEGDLSPGAQRKDASPSSPHLFPAPIKTTAVYLGWSDTAKRNFDEAKSPTSSRPNIIIPLPQKPTDDDLTEPESPSILKRPNLFGNVFDGWRENKAQKKREDLKKMIRVVPSVGVVAEVPGEEPTPSPTSRPSSRRGSLFNVPALPAVLPRRMSTYGWL